ncbi:MAG TPA: TonB-dependent receptor, partial [Sphingobacteriaceae bacterium]
MKLIKFLIFISFVHTGFNGYSQVTLKKENVLLGEVLQAIEKQTGYVFLYTDTELVKEKISIQVKNASIVATLNECLKGLPYTFKIVENNILLKREDHILNNSNLNSFNLPITIQGTVTDKEGIALPGATIIIDGTNRGVISDINGEYSIAVSDQSAVLVFSFLGYNSEKIEVGSKTRINIVLTERAEALGEIVVAVGFGTQKKASVVGAVSNIDIRELKKAAPSNLTNAIGGRVPGLVIRTMDGAIGGTQNRYSNGDLDDAQFYIRGKATTNGQAPLVLIDGVEGSFSRINPEDIDQFSVLKDASATAVYGVRGANGVILITTRQGATGSPKINLTSQVRMIKPLDFPKFLGSYDYAMLYNEARKNSGQAPVYTNEDLEHYRTGDSPFTHSDVNWRDLLLKDYTTENQHIANITGGTSKVRYYISGEFNQAGGLFVSSRESKYNYRRFNLRTNLDFTITPSTQLDIKVNGRLNDLNFGAKGESSGQRVNATAWGDIVNRLPNTSPLYNPNGTYAAGSGAIGWNSLSDLYDSGFFRRLQNTLESNFVLTQKLDFLVSGLYAKGKYAMSFNSGSQKYVYKQPAIWRYDPSDGSYTLHRAATIPIYSNTSPFNNFKRTQYVEASVNYDRAFGKIHKVSAMGVFIQNTDEVHINLPRSFRGVSGRATYAYKDKYLLEGNIGYNGSDQFSKGRRYAVFPAGALGWVVSEERFMKDYIKVIDFLKIRGSYGEVGNDQIAGYSYLYRYEFNSPPAPGTSNANSSYYSLGVSPVSQIGLMEGTLGNDQVSWEVARKANVGLDLKLFKSHLTFTGDLFQEKRNNILAKRNDLPLYTGLSASKLPALNIGKVTNRGYEMELSYNDNLGNVHFTVGGNYTFVRNTIDYIAETPQRYAYQTQAGHPIDTPFGYIWTGKFYDFPDLTNPDVPKPVGSLIAGDLRFEDLNKDGVIDSDDKTYYGYSDLPEKIFGFNFNLTFKGFDISTFWQGASNVSIRPSGPISNEFAPNVQPFHKEGRWVYDPSRGLDTRATATYPALQPGGSAYTREASTFNLLNAEYLRLKIAEIGFTLPKQLTEKIRVEN